MINKSSLRRLFFLTPMFVLILSHLSFSQEQESPGEEVLNTFSILEKKSSDEATMIEKKVAIEKEPDQLKQAYESSKSKIIEGESKKRSVLRKIYELNKEIKKISENKGSLTTSLVSLKWDAKKIAKEVAVLENKVALQKEILFHRLRSLYKISGSSFVQALFSSNSIQDVENSVEYLSILADKDYEFVKSYEFNIKKLKVTRDNLKMKVKTLVKVQKRIKRSESSLLKEQREKAKLVSQIDQTREKQMENIRKIRKKSVSLNKDLLEEAHFFEAKGQLIWPVNGSIKRDFGIYELGRNVKVNHKGLRIHPIEKQVKAVFRGKVEYSGYLDGYNKVIILSHGDNYFTTYANLFELKAKRGDEIAAGEIIAEAYGDRGLDGSAVSAQASLNEDWKDVFYFEIRHFSQPENPSKWLEKKKMNISSNSF